MPVSTMLVVTVSKLSKDDADADAEAALNVREKTRIPLIYLDFVRLWHRVKLHDFPDVQTDETMRRAVRR
jgi:hypothetical protein